MPFALCAAGALLWPDYLAYDLTFALARLLCAAWVFLQWWFRCGLPHWCVLRRRRSAECPCYPVAACTISGLSKQPPCYWNVSTLAGSGAAGNANGQGTAATFGGPSGVSVDPATLSIYVSEFSSDRVRKVSPAGLVSAFAGSGTRTWADGLGAAASFNEPQGVPVGALGKVYVGDCSNQRVRMILPSGLVTTFAGSGTGGGNNGIGTVAQLNNPTDIALDSSGTHGYIVEQAGGRIRRIVLSTAVVTTLAGSGTAGFADNVNGLAAQFNQPTSAVWHPSGVLYVTDGYGGCLGCGNHRIRVINISSSAVLTLAGNGAAGGLNGVGTTATLNQPRGITLDATFSVLYIAEQAGNRIRSISLSTALVQTVAGSGTAGFSNGFGIAALFNQPIFLASSPSGILYTADRGNNRIRQLTCVPCPASYYCFSGAPVLCPPGSYCPLSSINATLCPAGTFSNITGASSSSTCTPCSPGYYSATPGAVLSTACSPCAAGTYSTTPGASSTAACAPCSAGAYSVQGSTACAFTSTTCPIGTFANGPAACEPCSPATACTVAGLAAQPPCYWNVSTLAGSGAAGWADGQGTAAVFNQPHGVSVDPVTLSVYVGEYSGHRVRKISPTGLVSTFAGSGSGTWTDGLGTAASFLRPHGTPVDSLGHIYVGDYANHRVRKIHPSGLVSTLVGSGIAGAGNGIGTAAQLHNPTDVAFDSNGTEGYIVEQDGNRIRSIVFSTAAVLTLAGSGTAGFADNANGLLAQFSKPTSAAWHPSGRLYVGDGDGGNNRIRIISISTSAVSTLAGNGAAGGLDGVGTTATFNKPRGVSLDATFSVLYVAEDSGHRIRSISLSSALVSTLAGSGTPSYGDGFGIAARFNRPILLASSPSGVLYTAEGAGSRIRQLTCIPCPASFYCFSGAPVLCPAGSYCPLSSINPTLCPTGSFSNAGATNCTLCPAGSFTTSTGSVSCQPCPGGHYCPAGTSSWARLNCGRGNYCPDGSGAPQPCPFQVPPTGGWGALEVQGPAFNVETARCLNHCFWNFTSGDGALSKC